MKGVLLLVLWISLVGVNSEDFYAAFIQLKDVFHCEDNIILKLENSMTDIENSIIAIKKTLNEMKNYKRTIEDDDRYLQNPINAFIYIKYLVKYIPLINSTLQPIFGLGNIFDDLIKVGGVPTKNNMDGAASAILRAQRTFDLKVNDLANGLIINHRSSPLTVEDCMFIAVAAYHNGFITAYKSWVNHVHTKCFDASNSSCDIQLKTLMLEHAAWSEYIYGNKETALEFTKTLLSLDPNHKRGQLNKKYLEEEVYDIPPALRSGKFIVNPEGKHESTGMYYFACRGLPKLSEDIKSQLKCSYFHRNNPYLMLGPIKEEEAYLDPKIVILKDIIFDSEIVDIQDISKLKLARSGVYGLEDADKVRVSKVAWLNENNGKTPRKILQRFSIYTGLFPDSSDALQVVNYGLGGHYITHMDAFPEEFAMNELEAGNRLATLLIYMNDVEIGGETVFPELGVSVKPEKGSAVLWFNLYNNGSVDGRTEHGACPVVIGTKWAINLWYYEAYNVFNKPCLPQSSLKTQ